MKLRIDVVSDFVCPWCFIGERRRVTAMQTFAARNPAVRQHTVWHAFLLNPSTPAAGEPYRLFMERKFGSAAAVDELHERVAQAGRAEGIAFDFAAMKLRPSTRAAHALVARVQQAGGDAAALVERLFAAHFLEGRNIGSSAVLADLAACCGLDAGWVAQSLAAAPPADLEDFARELGVSGVPLFVFNRRVAVTGAQPPDSLVLAMAQSLPES